MTKESMAMPCWPKTSETYASNSIAPNVEFRQNAEALGGVAAEDLAS